MEPSWPCVVCDIRFSSPPHPRGGVHNPSKEWARLNGLVVKDGRWIPLVAPELRAPVKMRKKKEKPRGLFDVPLDLEAPEEYNGPEPEFSDSIEDYEA